LYSGINIISFGYFPKGSNVNCTIESIRLIDNAGNEQNFIQDLSFTVRSKKTISDTTGKNVGIGVGVGFIGLALIAGIVMWIMKRRREPMELPSSMKSTSVTLESMSSNDSRCIQRY
jgi:hypothetical protein